LRSSDCALVLEQVIDAQHGEGNAAIGRCDAIGPCSIEVELFDAGDDVDAIRLDANLEYRARRRGAVYSMTA
jgi:hypothetical protein